MKRRKNGEGTISRLPSGKYRMKKQVGFLSNGKPRVLTVTDETVKGCIKQMDAREKEVLNMQLILIPILAKAWNKTYFELSDMFKTYDILSYIDVCYEKYNSTGNQGIIDDLKEYIEMQGGNIG